MFLNIKIFIVICCAILCVYGMSWTGLLVNEVPYDMYSMLPKYLLHHKNATYIPNVPAVFKGWVENTVIRDCGVWKQLTLSTLFALCGHLKAS